MFLQAASQKVSTQSVPSETEVNALSGWKPVAVSFLLDILLPPLPFTRLSMAQPVLVASTKLGYRKRFRSRDKFDAASNDDSLKHTIVNAKRLDNVIVSYSFPLATGFETLPNEFSFYPLSVAYPTDNQHWLRISARVHWIDSIGGEIYRFSFV